jgi:beta-lactamase regulating signal transducer with metallopeptidase domain
MGGIMDAVITGAPRYEIIQMFVDVSLKGALICSVAALAALLMRGYSAYTRKMIWITAICAVILIPVSTAVKPVWNLSILPEISKWSGGVSGAGDVSAVSEKEISTPAATAGDKSTSGSAGGSEEIWSGMHWSEAVLAVWLAGAIVMIGWSLFTLAVVSRISARAVPADRRLKTVQQAVSLQIGLKRDARLVLSGRLMTAITTGIIDPVVILPSSATTWSDERLRLVLSHELAHVKRWDGGIELLAHLATVLFWFNPFVWLAVRQLRIERERDCDNAVLNSGARPSEYATLLMDIAADLGSMTRPAWEVVTISQGSNLKDRLLCILNPSINRSTGGRRSAFVAGILVLTMVLPLSISGIWETQAQEKQDKQDKLKKEEQLKKKQLTEEQIKKKKMKMEKEGKKYSSPAEKVEAQWSKITKSENSAAVVFAKALKTSGHKKAEKKLMKMKSDPEGKFYIKEGEFNTLGYVFLYNKKVKDAIFVFQKNVEMFPESWNTYDSLGEGYLVAGKLDKATKLYEKSIAMNPENENGIKMLAKIEEMREQDVAKKAQ